MKIIKNQSVTWGKIPRYKNTKLSNDFAEFVEDGSHTYADYDYFDRSEWVEPFIFHARIHIDDSVRGRSAANFKVTDEDNNRFTIHLNSLLKIIQSVGIEQNGYVEGYWQFVKRGQNYGIEFVGKELD